MKVYDKKSLLKILLNLWILEDSTREKKYGYALDLIEGAYRKNKSIELTRIYLMKKFLVGQK